MYKWLRTHNKQIMAALVLLAMFSFIGGSALVSLLQPNRLKEPYATALGQTLTQGDMQEAQHDIKVLEELVGRQARGAARIWQFGRPDLTPAHWLILLREAQNVGLKVSDAEIDSQLEQFPADYVKQVREANRISQADVRQALEHRLLILKSAARVRTAATPSEPQVRHFVNDTQDKVKVRFVTIDAKQFVNPSEAVPEAELAAQFEKDKDHSPATSESGFGYKHPRRVRLQYIVASVPEIAPQMDVTLESVKAYWKSNHEKYQKTVYDTPTSSPTSGPATSQPEPQARLVEKTFTEARPDIERELRQRSALQAAEQAMRKAASALIRPWLDVKAEESGFKPIPVAARDPDLFKATSERFAKELGIPIRYGETGLISREELVSNADLRGAALGGAAMGGGLAIVEYAFRVPGFFEPKSPSDTEPVLQLYQPPDAPLVARTFTYMNNQFQQMPQRVVLFRVVESAESAAPSSLSEVREQVERDVRLMRAYERSESTAQAVWAVAARLGLDAVADLFAQQVEKQMISKIQSPAAFAKRLRLAPERIMAAEAAGEPTQLAPSVQGIGSSLVFVDACFELADKGWKTEAPAIPAEGGGAAATTRPAKEPPPVGRLVGLPAQRLWAVVEFDSLEGVDEGKYAAELRQSAFFTLLGERAAILQDQWFDPEHIERRAGFKKVEGATAPREGIQYQDIPPPFVY